MILRNKKQPQDLCSRAGFTMLEVVVAMAVGAVGVMAFIGLQLKAVEISDESRNRTNAAYIASEMAERMMSNAQDYNAQQYYRGEIGNHWDYDPGTSGYFNTYNYCSAVPAPGSGCDIPAQAAFYDIIEVKELARNMLPNGNVGHRTCGDGDTFDCLVVAWGDSDVGTCNPAAESSCYILQLKIW